jgi:excisionase family DNA binding protein
MKPLDLQFDLRKNPDSPRVHGLRIAVSGQSNAEQQEPQSVEAPPPVNPARMQRTFALPLNDAPTGATEGEGKNSGRQAGQVQSSLRHDVGGDSGRLLTIEEVASLLHVPVSWVYGRMRKRSLERLPAYRLGKYWRFREDEIHAWVNRRGSPHAT